MEMWPGRLCRPRFPEVRANQLVWASHRRWYARRAVHGHVPGSMRLDRTDGSQTCSHQIDKVLRSGGTAISGIVQLMHDHGV